MEIFLFLVGLFGYLLSFYFFQKLKESYDKIEMMDDIVEDNGKYISLLNSYVETLEKKFIRQRDEKGRFISSK